MRLVGLPQPQVSKHLRVLREVGAVDVRDDGRRRLYRLNGLALKPIHDWVSNYERLWSDRFDQLDLVLEDLKLKDVMSSPSDRERAGLPSSSADYDRAGRVTVEPEEASSEHRNGT